MAVIDRNSDGYEDFVESLGEIEFVIKIYEEENLLKIL